jgi:hypothetical protein
MFYYDVVLKDVYVGNKWSMNAVTNSTEMFYNNQYLVGGAGTAYSTNHKDKEYARVDDPTNGNPGYFIYQEYIEPR